jgi:hypothetical protein
MRSFIICALRHILLGGQIKEDKMSGACSTYEIHENEYKILVRKPAGKRSLGMPR